MKRIFIYVLACILFSLNALAQLKVGGRVTDAKDGSPLPSVNIIVKGTSSGTVTNVDGTFSLNVPNGNSVLIFSYTGYTPQEVTVGAKTNFDIKLETKSSTLNDVVVIGYGAVKKSDLTGAVTTLKAEQLMDKPVPNISQALQGKVAGVDVNVNSSTPGQAAKVRIRGVGSISSNIDPLYVVDGVIGVDGNSINPYDIASIEVLKDASSTAIYGARGANGVIMVTTKRGVRGDSRITYEGSVSLAQLTRHLPALNSEEFLKVYNDSYKNATKFDPLGGTWAPEKALNHANYPLLFDDNDKPLYNTNWEDEVYKPAVSTTHYLNFQGGNDKTIYSLSLGYLNQNGLMIESGFKRYNARLTIDNDVNKWLTIGGNFSIIQSSQKVVSDGNGGLNVPRMVNEALPILPVKYPDGNWAGNSNITGMEGGSNPVHIARNRDSTTNNQQLFGNVYMQFHLAKDLEFKTDFGYNLNSFKNKFYSASDLSNLSKDQGGVSRMSNYTNSYWQSENYLTWNKQITSKQRLTALAGISFQKYNSQTILSESQNFVDDFFRDYLGAGSVRQNLQSLDYIWSMNSYFGRLTYSINDKYLFTATGRYDGSSKFGVNNKYAFFPSAGAAWRISEEDFMKNSKTFSLLKLRASYGTSGNQEIGQYRSIAQIQPSTTVMSGINQSTLLPNYIGNADLKWERSIQADAGIELGMFKDRILMNVDLYNRTTKDLLLQTPTPWSAGLRSANVYKNVGSVRNTGIEVNLSTINIKKENFSWTTNFIFTTNKNKILKLNNGNADIFPGPNFLGQTNVLRVGEAIGSFYGRTRLGTWSTSEEAEAAKYNLKPGDRKYRYNADGSEYYSIIGRSNPKWTGNFSSTIIYKGVDFSFDIRIVQGVNTAANFKHSVEDRQTIANSLKTVLNGWTPENQNTMISQVRTYKFAQDSKFDTWWVEDGSFIRGQNFMLGYTMSDAFNKRMKIQRLRVYASVQNLFLITNYTGYDPEVDTYNAGYGSNSGFSQNLDFFSYPRPRTWNVGVSLGL